MYVNADRVLIWVAAGLAIALLAFFGYVAVYTINQDSGSATAGNPPAPVNSEGKPAVGPSPAPPNDPCWKQTARAVRISPADGGQSAMPQRCIDKGF